MGHPKFWDWKPVTRHAYRESVEEKKWNLAVAGNFNSGTNFLAELLRKNCVKKPFWQVPWGKHYPAYYRETNKAKRMEHIHYDDIMPVVAVRDPYTWMQTCEGKVRSRPCRLLRDLLFHGETVVPQICACAGMKTKGKFHHKRTVANWNNGIDKNYTHGAGLLQSIIRYGNPIIKRKGYTPCQLWAARDLLDPKLMNAFHYRYVEPFGDNPSDWEDCFRHLKES